jgi:hypothetical protein
MKKNVTGILPVTFHEALFSSENISSEGFQIGLLIPMPFEAMKHHHRHHRKLGELSVGIEDN